MIVARYFVDLFVDLAFDTLARGEPRVNYVGPQVYA